MWTIAPLTCPASGAHTLVLVEGQQGADAPVGAGVVGVARGVLGRLAVLPGVSQRTDAGGAARPGHAGHGAVPSIQAVARLTRILVLAVFTQEAGRAPGRGHKNTRRSMTRGEFKANRGLNADNGAER